MKNQKTIFIAALIASLLAACSGGGDKNSSEAYPVGTSEGSGNTTSSESSSVIKDSNKEILDSQTENNESATFTTGSADTVNTEGSVASDGEPVLAESPITTKNTTLLGTRV